MSQNTDEQTGLSLMERQSRTNTGNSDNGNSAKTQLTSDTSMKSTEGRPLSDVFLPTDTPMDPSKSDASGTERTKRDSGYITGASTSSCMAGTENPPPKFYFSQDSMESDHFEQQQDDEFGHPDDIMLDHLTQSGDNDDSDLSDIDDVEYSGASVQTLCEGDVPISNPMDIPSASCFHMAHDPAMVIMGATPPRSYMSHPMSLSSPHAGQSQDPEQTSITGHRFSTGCLSNQYALAMLLELKKDTRSGKLLGKGISVTSGRLHASSSRAELQRQRTISETNADDSQEGGRFYHRDRSQSAPDIGMRRKRLERQCAKELRKISDEFFEEFPRMKLGKASRDQHNTPVSLTTHAASYPGTSSSRQWWWQTIIQNLSPARVRPSEPSNVEASGNTMTKQDKGDGK